MSVLAVVSKAVFDKEARVGKTRLAIGDVWPTTRYASGSAALASLAASGDLYLVTVRPGERLWLVAILRNPKRDEEGWTSSPNTTPIRDISSVVSQLRFASGKGVSAAAGKLAMSLQTPRVLAEEDITLLEAPATASDAYAKVLAETPEMKKAFADAKAKAAADAARPSGSGLRFEQRRVGWRTLGAKDKELLAELCGELEDDEARTNVEVIDVLDETSDEKLYLFALWPFGSGGLVDIGSGKIVADVVQHHFDARGDPGLRARMESAYGRAREALRIREMVSFVPGADEDKPKLKSGPVPLLERIVAMRDAIARGKAPGQEALMTLVNEAIDFTKLRPVPLRRLFELDDTTRNALELIREGSQHPIANLVNVGLPAHGDLARFLGHAPPELLDTPVMLGAQAHPASFIVSDAVHDLMPYDDAIAALLTLPAETLTRLWSALAKLPPKGPLTGAYAAPPKGAQRGSPAATGAHAQRYVRFLTALGQRLPDRGERAAKAILTERADWVGRWLPQLTERPAMAVPHWLEQCVALALLARNARSAAEGAGELDPTYDALLSTLALYHDASYPLAIVLEDLAPARAGRIACAQLELIERFPSTEGAEAAVRLFEKSGGGPYMGALFRRVIAAIGLPARAALESAIARGSPQLRTLKECSSALAKTAQGTKKPETKTRATR